jgi:rare lipoprotein A (peptidoglycan hydrolase)
VYKDDPTAEKGTTSTFQKGKDQVTQLKYSIIKRDGKEVSRTLVSSVITQEEVDQVILQGTKVPPTPPTPQNTQTGGASWYDGVPDFTAAHRTLPFGTIVTVTNLDTGKSTRVRIADRGPFIAGRIIDLGYGAFRAIASPGQGVARVEISY